MLRSKVPNFIGDAETILLKIETVFLEFNVIYERRVAAC